MRRVRIGVVGCGAIAQVQHLPFLTELSEEFEVAAVCDASPSQTAYAARQFHVERQFTDYREMLESDVDAVLLCHSDPKTEAVIASLDAGKHAFVEKPICFSLDEADAIIEAAARSDRVVQAGYTKLFEPAYELAQREVAGIDDVRFVQVNHLHPNNDLHVRQFRTRRFDDLPEAAVTPGPGGARRGAPGGHRGRPAARAEHVLLACGQPDTRPVLPAGDVRRAQQGREHRDMGRGTRLQHDAGVSGGPPVRRDLGRPSRPVGLPRDAGGVRRAVSG